MAYNTREVSQIKTLMALLIIYCRRSNDPWVLCSAAPRGKEEGYRQKRRQRSSLLVGGTYLNAELTI